MPTGPEPGRSSNAVPESQRALSRADLEVVIRRAVELAQSQTDGDDTMSEAELLRIGSELGLSASHVRQALDELPQLDTEPRWYDKWFEKAVVSASRVVPAWAERTLASLEEYISAREYMQIVRKR